MLEFSPGPEMKKIAGLAEEFSKNILDEELLFVSDEATILDVSAAEPTNSSVGFPTITGEPYRWPTSNSPCGN